MNIFQYIIFSISYGRDLIYEYHDPYSNYANMIKEELNLYIKFNEIKSEMTEYMGHYLIDIEIEDKINKLIYDLLVMEIHIRNLSFDDKKTIIQLLLDRYSN